jgi:hypothetical protein
VDDFADGISLRCKELATLTWTWVVCIQRVFSLMVTFPEDLLGTISVSSVCLSHFLVVGNFSQRQSWTSLLNKKHCSIVVAHSHLLDFSSQMQADGRRISAVGSTPSLDEPTSKKSLVVGGHCASQLRIAPEALARRSSVSMPSRRNRGRRMPTSANRSQPRTAMQSSPRYQNLGGSRLGED